VDLPAWRDPSTAVTGLAFRPVARSLLPVPLPSRFQRGVQRAQRRKRQESRAPLLSALSRFQVSVAGARV